MNALLDLLTYSAFRPAPLDVEESISSRFRLRKLMLLTRATNRLLVVSAGRTHWRAAVATFDRAGAPTFTEPVVSPPLSNRDAVVDWLRDYATINKVVHVAVGIGYGFIVSALSAVARMGDAETMRVLRTEPSRLFGESNPAEEINDLVHHPEVDNSCLRFKIRASEMAAVREICSGAGLSIARVVCEQAQLLELAYVAGVSKLPKVRALLLGLPTSFLFVPLDGSGWHSVTYDPSLDDQAIGALLQAASQAIPPGGTLAYIDAGMPGMQDVLHSMSTYAPENLIKSQINASLLSITLN